MIRLPFRLFSLENHLVKQSNFRRFRVPAGLANPGEIPPPRLPAFPVIAGLKDYGRIPLRVLRRRRNPAVGSGFRARSCPYLRAFPLENSHQFIEKPRQFIGIYRIFRKFVFLRTKRSAPPSYRNPPHVRVSQMRANSRSATTPRPPASAAPKPVIALLGRFTGRGRPATSRPSPDASAGDARRPGKVE